MAITCTPEAISAAAECYSCSLDHRQKEAAQVYLLAQIAVAVGALTAAQITPAALSAASTCFDCGPDARQLQAMMVYLLCQIQAA